MLTPKSITDASPDGCRRRITRGQAACLIVILFAGAALRLRLLDVPLERDEGEYGVMAQTILRGELPYVAAYNMKLPGVFYAYALVLAVFGNSATALHLGLIPVTSVSAVLVFLLGRRWFDAATGLVSAAAFLLLSVSAGLLGFSANAEHFLVPPMVAGWLCLEGAAEGRRGRVLAAGALFGVGILMKQHGISFAAAAGLWLVIDRVRTRGFRSAHRPALAFALGVLAPYGAALLYFSSRGAFDYFWFWTIRYTRYYVSELTLIQGLPNLDYGARAILPIQWPILLLSVIGSTSVGWDAMARRQSGRLAALAVGSVLSVCPGWYFRQHYFLMAAPCVALFAGLGVSALARFAVRDRSDTLRAGHVPVAATLSILAFGTSLWLERDYYFRLTPREISRKCYGANPFPEALEIARYLREHTDDNDRIAVVGSEPQIYFYAQRRPGTRFIYTYPLMENHPFAADMQRDMCREIDATRPRYIVSVTVNSSWLRRPRSYRHIFECTLKLLRERYELVGVFDIKSDDRTDVYWGEAVKDHQPNRNDKKPVNYLLVYERKPSP